MIEEILNWSDKNIKQKLSANVFKENKLGGMLGIVFKASPYAAINMTYPNRFKQWEFKNVPMNFWTLETGIEATKWLIEEKLKWNDEDIKEKLSQKIFKENNLSGVLQYVFTGSPYDVINSVYPDRFKQWEFRNVPMNFWTLDNGIKATRWLIEEKLKWNDEDIKEKLSANVFSENNLGGMLGIVFNASPYAAINMTYPNRFKKEDLKSYQYNVTKNK